MKQDATENPWKCQVSEVSSNKCEAEAVWQRVGIESEKRDGDWDGFGVVLYTVTITSFADKAIGRWTKGLRKGLRYRAWEQGAFPDYDDANAGGKQV